MNKIPISANANSLITIGRDSSVTGTMTIQSGATVHSASGELAFNGGQANVTITGANSAWIIDSTLLLASTGLSAGLSPGTGSLTLANGGILRTGGTITIANNPNITGPSTAQGTLNIGAASGSPAAAPGTLTAPVIQFGNGTGTIVFNHTSNAYVFAPAISGCGTIEVLAGNTILAGDMRGFCGTMNISAGADLTTMAAQQASLQSLAADQQAMAAQSHATAGELLGMTRPVDNSRFVDYGAMFGSAVAYAGGQYADRGVTVLGGIAYGAQDYRNIRQGDAPTVAAALRYSFDDVFGKKGRGLTQGNRVKGPVTNA